MNRSTMDEPSATGTAGSVPDSTVTSLERMDEDTGHTLSRGDTVELPTQGSEITATETDFIFSTPALRKPVYGKTGIVEEGWTLRSCDSGFSDHTFSSTRTDFSTRSSSFGSSLPSSPESEICESQQRRITLTGCEFSPVNRDSLGAPKGRKLKFNRFDSASLAFEDDSEDPVLNERIEENGAESVSKEPEENDISIDNSEHISNSCSKEDTNLTNNDILDSLHAKVAEDLHSSLQEMSLEESSSSRSSTSSCLSKSPSPTQMLSTRHRGSFSEEEEIPSMSFVEEQISVKMDLSFNVSPESRLRERKSLSSLKAEKKSTYHIQRRQEEFLNSLRLTPKKYGVATSSLHQIDWLSPKRHERDLISSLNTGDSKVDPYHIPSNSDWPINSPSFEQKKYLTTSSLKPGDEANLPSCVHLGQNHSKRPNDCQECFQQNLFSPTKAMKTKESQNIYTKGTVHYLKSPLKMDRTAVRKILVESSDDSDHSPETETRSKSKEETDAQLLSMCLSSQTPRRIRQQRSQKFERSPQFIRMSPVPFLDSGLETCDSQRTSRLHDHDDLRSPLHSHDHQSRDKFDFGSEDKSSSPSLATRDVKVPLRHDSSHLTSLTITKQSHSHLSLRTEPTIDKNIDLKNRPWSSKPHPNRFPVTAVSKLPHLFHSDSKSISNTIPTNFEEQPSDEFYNLHALPVRIPYPKPSEDISNRLDHYQDPQSAPENDRLQKVIQAFSPSEPSRLIGRNVGVRKIDVVASLHMQGFALCLTTIFQYLSPADLLNVSKVNSTWRHALVEDKHAFHRYCQHQEKMAVLRNYKKGLDKENVKRKAMDRSIEESLTASRGHLTNVQAQATIKDAHRDASISPKKKEEPPVLSEDQFRSCPRCQSPSLIKPGQDRAICIQQTCGYDFCLNCFASFHKSRPCKPLLRQLSTAQVAGTHKSRKNLKRL